MKLKYRNFKDTAGPEARALPIGFSDLGRQRAVRGIGSRPNLNCVLILFCFLVLLCFSTRALGTTNEALDALPTAVVDEKTSDSGPLPRDPFWPIGYMPASAPGGASWATKPAGPETGKEKPKQTSDLSEMLKIGGVVKKGGKFYATINGFTVQAGEVVTAVYGGEVYKFLVTKIDLKKVQVKLLK